MDRLKEIKHQKWILKEQLKELKKELKKLQEEENMINGYKVIERKKQYGKSSKAKIHKK